MVRAHQDLNAADKSKDALYKVFTVQGIMIAANFTGQQFRLPSLCPSQQATGSKLAARLEGHDVR